MGLGRANAESPKIDRPLLLQLAHDLSRVWNAPSTDTRTKQRLVHVVVREIVCDLDENTNEAVIHWTGGRRAANGRRLIAKKRRSTSR
jgi:hypothetical protein